VIYDHFLAVDENEFTEQFLYEFSIGVYKVVEQHLAALPPGFAAMFPYMKNYNWLFNYRTLHGTRKSLGGVVRRARYLHESDTAAHLLQTHYQPLQAYYRQFWKDLKPFARRQLDIIRGMGNKQ
jgi:acyl carrier protein phosphodiesterase